MNIDLTFQKFFIIASMTIYSGFAFCQSGVDPKMDLLDPPYSYLDQRETYDSARMPLYVFLAHADRAEKVDKTASPSEASIAKAVIRSFISGVVDAGENITWCVRKSNIPPYEIDNTIISALREIRAHDSSLEVRGAAKMIAKLLERNYTCSK
jgi:hypothetical protein